MFGIVYWSARLANTEQSLAVFGHQVQRLDKRLLNCEDRTMSSTHFAVILVEAPRPWLSKSCSKLGQVKKEGTKVQLCFMSFGIRNFLINSPFLPI